MEDDAMGSRSMIGRQNEDGSIEAIYCHFDGGLWHVGALLHEHWNDPEKVGRLLGLGDLSELGSEIGEKHCFEGRHSTAAEFERVRNWCLAYGRDRGEEGCAAQRYENAEAFHVEGYGYLLVDGRWVFFHADEPPVPLAEAVEQYRLKKAQHPY
ncbi:hypothetical protein [Magnetospirillum sp. XM-1]|uniref:hypothetical protein n=1 Tax=Magnetospirillum sp. XM-1 TaxID=1663591 RepID=UPI0012E3EDB1|nr:hypothetical protein [Magnetospirillum sp. XM-1]